MPVPAEGTHFQSSAGKYWDARTYDVKALLKPGNKVVVWEQSFVQDCLAFAFSALAFQATIVDADADDTDDALDNCPGVKNPDQADTDDDGLGDLCDNCPSAPTRPRATKTTTVRATSATRALSSPTPTTWIAMPTVGATRATPAPAWPTRAKSARKSAPT